MPFYFAFRENRRSKWKLKRSATFGRKEKSRTSCGGLEGWSDNSDNNLAAYDNNAVVSLVDHPRRHSLEPSLLNRTCVTSPPLRRVLTPLTEERKGPPKPPRMMQRRIFTCENEECQKSEELLGMIAINLKACPSCFTHYCSTQCRVAHWPQHKLVCHYGRITSYMKTISEICQGGGDADIQGLLSSVASSGYRVKGRGCVMLIFASPSAARLFIEEKVGKTPTYSSLKQVESLGVKSNHKKNLLSLISNYNPEYELVLNVAIVADRNLPAASPAPRNKEPSVIQQFIVSLKRSEENTSKETSRRFSL